MKEITTNDKAINGVNFTQQFCDTYNALQRRKQKFIDAGLKVPENILNGSFNLMNSLILAVKK